MPLIESARAQKEAINVCPLCFGCGMEIVKGRGARTCQCAIRGRIESYREEMIAKIPSLYENLSLENIAPDLTRHRNQAREIKKLRANPNSNFAICGRYGSGKTHLLWALYRTQLESRRVFAGTLEQIVGEHKKRIEIEKRGDFPPPLSIVPEKFRQKSTPWTLFIDDIDKETPTEFVSKILFALLDAATSFQHQIVFSTNLHAEDLTEHFERADKRFGGAIARRLMDNTEIIEMF